MIFIFASGNRFLRLGLSSRRFLQRFSLQEVDRARVVMLSLCGLRKGSHALSNQVAVVDRVSAVMLSLRQSRKGNHVLFQPIAQG